MDGDDPKNKNPIQNLEEEENIRVHILDLDEKFGDSVKELAKKNNYIINSSIWGIHIGMQFALSFLQKSQ